MEIFLKSVLPHEKTILQYYVDRCASFHVAVTIINYVAALLVIIGPFLFPDPKQQFPTFAEYPFSVDGRLTTLLLYLHQSLAGLQLASGATIDCQSALTMWFAGARLDILANELIDVTTIIEFQSFVQKHQRILSYSVNVTGTVRYIALASTWICGLATVMSSLQLIGVSKTYFLLLINLFFLTLSILISEESTIVVKDAICTDSICFPIESHDFNLAS